MDDGSDRIRLAELVAALSLGIDLGLGQPMEHVLRQCLMALRIAERVGLDESARATVYYTALLINVGCHTDAHEQAKWFGDDIALKAAKYDYGLHSTRGAIARVTTPQCGLRHSSPGRPFSSSLRSVSAPTVTMLTAYPSSSARHSVPGPSRFG